MRACVRLAKPRRVHIGAHPGAQTGGESGRGPLRMGARALELMLLQQVGTLERIAREEGVRLHHIKLHGSLYHAVESDVVLAGHYVRMVRHWWPRCVLYARAGGAVVRAAQRAGVEAWEEVFADRAYCRDGTLVPRGEPGAVLTRLDEIVERLRRLRRDGRIECHTGEPLRLRARTLCLHGDTPGAVQLVRALARVLTEPSPG